MSVEAGDLAPDFTLKSDANENWTLSEHRGRNVVLVFYPLAFSGACTKELHAITELSSKFDSAGAEVVGVSVDSRHAQAAFKRYESLSATLLADFQPRGEVARQYGIYLEDWGYAGRGTFVIDKDGRVASKVVVPPGEQRDPEEYLRTLENCPV